MLPQKHFSTKQVFLSFSVILIFLFLSQQSCKKIDSQPTSTVTRPVVDPAIKFFNLPANVNPSVKKVADKIKMQNDQKHFLNQFVKKQGYPLWDKAVITTVPVTNVSSSQHNFGSSTNTSSSAGSGTEDLVFVPLALQDSNQVHGALYCKVNGDSVSIRLIDGTKYNWYTAHPDSIGMTGEQATLLLLKLDKVAFGDSLFKIKDSLAFGTNVSRSAKYIKIINTNNTSAASNNTGSTASYGHWEYYDISVNYVTYEPNLCGCDATPCPDGSMHEESHTINISGSMWVEDAWYDPNSGGAETSGGGGGGGYNGGGNNEGLPIDPVGNDPIDPVPTVYHLSSNDIRVINQLNAEDAEVDNAHSNLDCQGTKRTGNIFFNGVLEHWLIQLDYIAKHPIDGDREYAIPQGSLTGGRGYADLVNMASKEIFEIKPPALLNNGIQEVGNYVIAANQNCPTVPMGQWHQGTNYTGAELPYKDPTKILVATLSTNGVITYKTEDKLNNPNPVPVVVPTTVLDKLKDLVDRIKNRLSDADAVISEYMAGHPELVTYIKSAAIGAAVTVVVGTIVEDIFTGGAGILDDWASFTLAYRIVRFAWAL